MTYKSPNDHELFQRMTSGDLVNETQLWTWYGKHTFIDEFERLVRGIKNETERHDQADLWAESLYDLFNAFERPIIKFERPNDLTPLAYLDLDSLNHSAEKFGKLKHFWPTLSAAIIRALLGAELGSYVSEINSGRVRKSGLLSTLLSSDARRNNERIESNLIVLTNLYQQASGSAVNYSSLEGLLKSAVGEKGVFVSPMVFEIVEQSRSKKQV